MAYCPRCGKQNPDDAKYCNNCGADLATGGGSYRRRDEDRCNEECSRGRSGLLVWGIIVVIIGIGIIISAIANFWPGAPSWLTSFEWWWLILIIVGALILAAGVRMLTRAGKSQ